MRSLPPCPLFPFLLLPFTFLFRSPVIQPLSFTDCSVCCMIFYHSRSFLVLLTGQKDEKPPPNTTTLSLLPSLSLAREREEPVAQFFEITDHFLHGVYPDSKMSESLILHHFRYRGSRATDRNRLQGRTQKNRKLSTGLFGLTR